MKKNILLFVVITFVMSSVNYAQSDYEKTQSFKKQYKQLEDAIKNASSLDECIVIGENIAKLKSEFENDSGLLDKSLYPDNFETLFPKSKKRSELEKEISLKLLN
jgi:hypothetical protein